jgi:hypothetical protein
MGTLPRWREEALPPSALGKPRETTKSGHLGPENLMTLELDSLIARHPDSTATRRGKIERDQSDHQDQ